MLSPSPRQVLRRVLKSSPALNQRIYSRRRVRLDPCLDDTRRWHTHDNVLLAVFQLPVVRTCQELKSSEVLGPVSLDAGHAADEVSGAIDFVLWVCVSYFFEGRAWLWVSSCVRECTGCVGRTHQTSQNVRHLPGRARKGALLVLEPSFVGVPGVVFVGWWLYDETCERIHVRALMDMVVGCMDMLGIPCSEELAPLEPSAAHLLGLQYLQAHNITMYTGQYNSAQ